MILCITLQGMALLPHHHDNGSEAICFDFRHCIVSHDDFKTHQGCTNRASCDGHSMQQHNHARHDNCVAGKLAVIKPQNDSRHNLLHSALLTTPLNAYLTVTPAASNEQYISTILLRNIEQYLPPTESQIITYITKALPLRAPTLLS